MGTKYFPEVVVFDHVSFIFLTIATPPKTCSATLFSEVVPDLLELFDINSHNYVPWRPVRLDCVSWADEKAVRLKYKRVKATKIHCSWIQIWRDHKTLSWKRLFSISVSTCAFSQTVPACRYLFWAYWGLPVFCVTVCKLDSVCTQKNFPITSKCNVISPVLCKS